MCIRILAGLPNPIIHSHRRSTHLMGTANAVDRSAANARRCKSLLFVTVIVTVTLLINHERPHQCRGPFKAFTNQRCRAVGGKPLFCFPPLACLPACPKSRTTAEHQPEHCRAACLKGTPQTAPVSLSGRRALYLCHLCKELELPALSNDPEQVSRLALRHTRCSTSAAFSTQSEFASLHG